MRTSGSSPCLYSSTDTSMHGSCLGLLTFALYINDIESVYLAMPVFQSFYADDFIRRTTQFDEILDFRKI